MRAILATALLVVLGLGAPAAQAAFPGTNGRIVYHVDEDCFDESFHLETANPDGTSPVVVPNTPGGRTSDPSWSPDGAGLAYNEDYTVAIIKPDGSEHHAFLASSFDQYPSWSPDGTKIVYTGETTGGDEISIMNPDGTGRTGTGVFGRG